MRTGVEQVNPVESFDFSSAQPVQRNLERGLSETIAIVNIPNGPFDGPPIATASGRLGM
jgi:hypothetical protein